MKTRQRPRPSIPAASVATAVAALAVVLVPEAAVAYGGPGSVITGIGAFLAAVVAVAAAVVGFFWFPLKRLYQKLRGEETAEEEEIADVP